MFIKKNQLYEQFVHCCSSSVFLKQIKTFLYTNSSPSGWTAAVYSYVMIVSVDFGAEGA